MRHLPKVLRYLRPHWKLVVVSVILMLVGALLGVLLPWPMKFLVDNVLSNEPMPEWLGGMSKETLLIVVVLAGLLLALAHNGLSVLDNYVNTKIDQSMVLDFRSDLFNHAQRLSLAYHDQKKSGMLIYAINSQADAAARLVMAIPPLVQSSLMLIGMVWVTFSINPTLALLALVIVPFLYYSVHFYVNRIQNRLAEVRGMEGESLSIIHEAISMLRVIVAFGREDHENRRFRTQGERTIKARVKVTVWQTLFSLAVNMATATGTALVLGYGAQQVLDGRVHVEAAKKLVEDGKQQIKDGKQLIELGDAKGNQFVQEGEQRIAEGNQLREGKITLGDLLIVMAYVASIYKPLETISTTVGGLQDIFMALRVAFKLLDTEPEIKDAPDAIAIERAQGQLTFESVYFSYRGRSDTLQDISFRVEPGQVVAVVGPTGAGKTTLVSLLPRFYDRQKGDILLDGIDNRKITLKSLRQQISVVLQEPLLFSGTITDNILYGRLDAGPDDIIAAAKAANAHDFIKALPNGYDTELGERGVQLSGGERQRIAVARAFLKDAPILILDEPTSSIDSKTEAVILDALDRLMLGRTTFMIAHRLSTVRRADIILVVDKGKLVEQGTHESLLAQGGLYHQLHTMQTQPLEEEESQDAIEEPDGVLEGQA